VRQIRRASISISSNIAEGFEEIQIKNLLAYMLQKLPLAKSVHKLFSF
jgi:four helix bundle protein